MSYMHDKAEKDIIEVYGEDYHKYGNYGDGDLIHMWILGYYAGRRREKQLRESRSFWGSELDAPDIT